jgi:hypothetical protein
MNLTAATSPASEAIATCNALVARRQANPADVSDAELIAARTVVWKCEDAAETEAERIACRDAGAAVSEALEAAYVAREAATVAPVVTATPDRANEILATLIDLSGRRDAARAGWFAADVKSATFAADRDAAQAEMDSLSAEIAPLMEELQVIFA